MVVTAPVGPIVHVVTHADRGGAQVVVGTLVSGLARRGHPVHLITGRDGVTAEGLRAEGIGVTVVPSIRHWPGLHDVRALRDLRHELQRLSPSLVHLHSSKAGLLGRISARSLRVPSVYTAHGWPFRHGGRTQRVVSVAGEWIGGHLGDAVICVSDVDAALARRWHLVARRRLWRVDNGLDHVDLPLRRTGERPHVVWTSRFEPPKRPDLVIEALALLDPSVRLTMLGDGWLQNRCRARAEELGIAERIDWTPADTDVLALLAGADVCVLASDFEGQPIAVLEAFRSGVPVVASAVGGIPELVSDRALLAPPGDANALAASLRHAIADRSRLARESALVRERWERRHAADRMIDAVESVYASVAPRRGS